MNEQYGPEWVDRQDPEVLAALMLHGTIEARKREQEARGAAKRKLERDHAVEAARYAERRARYLGLDNVAFHEELAQALTRPLTDDPLVIRTRTPEDVRSFAGGVLAWPSEPRRTWTPPPWPLIPLAFAVSLGVVALVLFGWTVMGLWRVFARAMDSAAARIP